MRVCVCVCVCFESPPVASTGYRGSPASPSESDRVAGITRAPRPTPSVFAQQLPRTVKGRAAAATIPLILSTPSPAHSGNEAAETGHQAESHKHSPLDAGLRRSGARQLYTAAVPAALATRMSFLLATPRRGVSCEPGNPSRLRHIHSMGVVLPSSSLGISPDRKPTRYEHVCCTRPMAPGPPLADVEQSSQDVYTVQRRAATGV